MLEVRFPPSTSSDINIYNLNKDQNKLKHIRGINGGLSKVFVVQPLTDPCTPLDRSFISYDKNSN